MKLAELDPRAHLRDNTRVFVREHAEVITRRLGQPLAVLEREMRHLKGGDGLLLKKRFLDAGEAWERYFWSRIAEHYLRAKLPLEEALRLADEDLLMLSPTLGPL